MSKIATINSQATAQNIRVESAIMALELDLKFTGEQSYPDFLNLVKTAQLEVNKSGRNGTVAIIQRMSILSLFELAQSNGGLILGRHNAAGSAPGASGSIAHAVELSDFGAIPLQDGEFFEVNIFDFPAAANGKAYTLDMYAVDFPALSSVHNVYEKVYFNANSPREIDVREVKTLSCPAAALDLLELTFKNGRRVRYSKYEIQAQMRDGLRVRSVLTLTDAQNGIHTQVNTITADLLYNVADAVTAKITTTDGVNVTLLKHLSL